MSTPSDAGLLLLTPEGSELVPRPLTVEDLELEAPLPLPPLIVVVPLFLTLYDAIEFGNPSSAVEDLKWRRSGLGHGE